MQCPACSHQNRPAAKFCESCGQPLAAAPSLAAVSASSTPGERRLVTVLFTDVVGSTALAERMDPEEWSEIISGAHRRVSEAIDRWEGTIAQLLGDGVLAFFGAPITHEDDPVRAVTAALDILESIGDYGRELAQQRRVANFQMRVGLNTGLVVAGQVGGDKHVEYLAVGDTVNLGARMQSAAEPNTVLISGSTARLIKYAFVLEPRGPLELKGKSEPVPAFRVAGRKAIPEPARGIEGLRSPLVGRERELLQLQERVAELRQGRGSLVSIVGEAGLGKSRLLAELRQWTLTGATPAARLRWLEGRSLSYETNLPYAPFSYLLNSYFDLRADTGRGPEGAPAEKYACVQAGCVEAVGEPGAELAPFLATLLGIQPPGADFELVRYLEPPNLRARTFQAVRQLFAGLAKQGPLVLVFEDLHWADPISLDLLRELTTLPEEAPVLLLTVFRAQQLEPAWRYHETAAREHPQRYHAVELEPLDEGSSRQLVANLLKVEDLPEKVRALILAKAEGNPFFVEEMIRSLLDAHLIVQEDDRWRATREIETIAMPDTLAGVIGARLDRLAPEPRRVAQTASVIGREFGFDLLESVAEPAATAASVLPEALHDLQQRELIRETSRLPDLLYVFKHALTQETAYASLLLSRRRELHRQVAESLERLAPDRVNDIGRHFLEARELARALPYLVEAGDRSARAYASPPAIELYQRAIEILQTVENLALARRAYEGLGGVLMLIGNLPRAAEVYHDLYHYAESRDDVPMQVSALNKLALTQIWLGMFPEVEHHLADAERLARASQDQPGLAEMYWVRCGICTFMADWSNAVRYLSESVQIGRDLNLQEQMVFGMTHMANTYGFMTEFDQMWETAQEGLALARQLGNQRFQSEILVFPIPYHYLLSGDLDGALREAEEGLAIGTRIGLPFGETLGAWMVGTIAALRGEYERAIAAFTQSLAAARTSSYPFLLIPPLTGLGSVYVELGSAYLDKVVEYHRQALAMLEHPSGVGAAGLAWVDLGRCVLHLGDVDTADQLFQKGLTQPTTHGGMNRPRFLTGAALIALARGNLDEAADLAQQARAIVDEKGMQYLVPEVALAQGRIAAAQGADELALSYLAAAEESANATRQRPFLWQAQAQAARVLESLGRTAEGEAKRAAAHATISEIAALFSDDGLRAGFRQAALTQVDQPVTASSAAAKPVPASPGAATPAAPTPAAASAVAPDPQSVASPPVEPKRGFLASALRSLRNKLG